MDEERRLANEREGGSTVGGTGGGRIRLAREKEGCSRRDSDGDTSKPTHTCAHPARTHARAGGCTLSRQAHYRLPDSHHELLEKSIEYKKSPWCARRAEPFPLPPSSFPSFSLSPVFVLALSLSPYLFLSLSPPPAARPASRRVSRARTRYPCVASSDEERERLACTHWRSTEIAAMRARTTAKDGDKDEGSVRGARGRGAGAGSCARVSDSIEASWTEGERSARLKERGRKTGEKRETRITL